MSAHGAAATNSRVYLPTNCSATLKVLKSSESAVGFQAVTLIFCFKIYRDRFECHPNDADRSATPTYYAYLVATRAKKWDISDENGSAVFTTNSGTQTSGERHCEFDYFKNKINKMSEKENVFKNNKPEGSSGKNNALLPDVFSWEKNSQPPEEYSKRKFTLPSLNNMIARVKCCKCTKNEDDKIYPLQPPRVPSIFNGTIHYG
ncbi:hypothetical protein PPACK8108_LOCUS19492 [Phakopsora pachyrhizi]|uniref:Uncharacterized protein n=1 Tax=Phakopsora pachyrhizi TaxID=170000 RepID=A0AAV0BG64_PHAPC|nr:hypothetical protein PPACK8108_LOCUS19492 [Phakopsora pachyrhizi]